jgi:hypothetical protein
MRSTGSKHHPRESVPSNFQNCLALVGFVIEGRLLPAIGPGEDLMFTSEAACADMRLLRSFDAMSPFDTNAALELSEGRPHTRL